MKLLFLGIDALDSNLLQRFDQDLPTIHEFRTKNHDLSVVSTFPPDSDTAWATIVTGLNPAEHGIVRFIDPLEKSYEILNKGTDGTRLHGRTFWDIASENGYKACAIFPHLCYPLWETESTMVTRGGVVADVQGTDPELLDLYPDKSLMVGVRGFPDRTIAGMTEYLDQLKRQAQADADFALKVLQKQSWDIFFVYWSTLDAIGHFFWNYFDTSDPNYEENNLFENVIPDMYQLFDQIVSEFIRIVDDDVTVIILSDHGHGARPYNLVALNDLLRKSGYLFEIDRSKNPHIVFIEKLKRFAVKTISRFGLGKQAGYLLRLFPEAINQFTKPPIINWDKTTAYATDMSGIKSYPYGGIKINKDAIDVNDYEKIRSEVIELITEKCRTPDGESMLKFISPREALYKGPEINKYPDIVLEFKYGYGVGWALRVPPIYKADTYNLVPGSHRGDTGVCVIRSPENIGCGEINLLDITPSILDLLCISSDYPFSGVSIFK